jgi:hypothetical protein
MVRRRCGGGLSHRFTVHVDANRNVYGAVVRRQMVERHMKK